MRPSVAAAAAPGPASEVAMGKAERFMLILVAIVLAGLFFAIAIAPHVPMISAGD